MGATDPRGAGPRDDDGRGERRRFVTRRHVEDAAASGETLCVRRRDVVTDEAAQRAADLGVRIEREGSRPAPGVPGAVAPAGVPGGALAGVPDADLRRAVRVAVVAELGNEPPGLDAAIDRVLARRRA